MLDPVRVYIYTHARHIEFNDYFNILASIVLPYIYMRTAWRLVMNLGDSTNTLCLLD